MEFPKAHAERQAGISGTVRARNFTPEERVYIGRAIEAEIGKRQGRRTDTELPENVPEVGTETRAIAAERAGFGNDRTYRQAKEIVEAAEAEGGEFDTTGAATTSGDTREHEAEAEGKTAAAMLIREHGEEAHSIATNRAEEMKAVWRRGRLCGVLTHRRGRQGDRAARASGGGAAALRGLSGAAEPQGGVI